jgi:trk system potassium uptake protein TrkA
MSRSGRSADYAVLGLGRLGTSVARRLEQLGQSVLVADIDRARVQEIASDVSEAVVLDATDTRALEEIDIASFDTVIVAIEDDFQASVLVTATLKQMGIAHVYCQAKSGIHQTILERLGAERVVRPLEETGTRLADELVSPGLAGSLVLGGGVEMVRLRASAGWEPTTVSAIERTGATVLVVIRGDALIAAPDADQAVTAGDELVIMATAEQRAQLSGMD